YGSVAALLAVATVPLPVLVGPLAAIVPTLLLATSIACDAGMYRFVLGRRGPAFLFYFGVLQFAVNVTIAVSVVVGVLQWLVSRRFRATYRAMELVTRPA
ncbi:MAG TPA: hypothetical protein VGD84_12475, partial [Pseudonocardiaceae bacterium]